MSLARVSAPPSKREQRAYAKWTLNVALRPLTMHPPAPRVAPSMDFTIPSFINRAASRLIVRCVMRNLSGFVFATWTPTTAMSNAMASRFRPLTVITDDGEQCDIVIEPFATSNQSIS